MLCSKVVVVFLVCLFAIVCGMPQNGGNSQDSSGLPFIQFTNGGIRFNFGGYHAAAGLGGLLGGSRTGGGLHASVGTPWGAHAGAGLGGVLGGDDATAGGGLYARAGLGNGRPDVAAGLGGRLDGSGRSSSPVSGGLFAGARMGDHGVGVSAGNANNGPSGSNGTDTTQGNDDGKASKGTSNIQIISHGGKKQHKIKQALSEEAGSSESSKQIVPAASKEVRELHTDQSTPPAAASAFNPLSAIPAPQALVGGAILEAPLAPPLPNQVNEVVELEKRPHRVKFVRPVWRVRKRLWGPAKYITIDSSVESQGTPETKDRKRRQAPNYNQNRPMPGNNGMPVINGNSGGFFDDIFKIPVSTLGAVNTFLNNNAS